MSEGKAMGGVPSTTKYIIHAKIEIDGVVEKPDVIGAIFGQTEGLLGDELDLRELQKSGRIGRIQVELDSKGGKSVGVVIVPSSLDKVETAIIASAIETIDKVGPCTAKVTIEKIEDAREEKRRRIIERAKEILRKWETEQGLELKEITEEVAKSIRALELVKYGEEGLPAGPEVDKSDTIIVVEGRADVINMLKHGYRNVIAIEGATVPETVRKLSKEKTVIAFVDGDRGGELVLKELLQVADVDYVAKAPAGKEVEELTGKEIAKCLRNKVPVEEYQARAEKAEEEYKPVEVKLDKELLSKVANIVDQVKALQGSLEALIVNENFEVSKKVPVRDLAETLQSEKAVAAVIFDGVVTQRIIDIAEDKGTKLLAGVRIGNVAKRPYNVVLMTIEELLKQLAT
ncbi:MAG: DNA primase [Candidatus Methanomethylicota archaeon]|uniref:DNA primase DnaG n=1 Tax=Thermoproteota archaeon TaxID=2056631 RepID=A0A497EW34_9CREN|nr:MAG: DNA primase [Candidatus Verstraetearchaeota archaeon]